MSLQDHISQRIKTSLDLVGVVGFFGDDAATMALIRSSVFEGGNIAGWYNGAGSFSLAKRLSKLSKSLFVDSMLPSPNVDPAALFEDYVTEGPAYRAAHSGTWIPRTGHVARMLEEECAVMKAQVVDGRQTTPIGVTIVDLEDVPQPLMHPKLYRKGAALVALLPIAASIATSVMCFLRGDGFAGGLIVVGMFASGVASITLRSARLTFNHPTAAMGAPAGDGIFTGSHGVIIVKGKENAVNAITRGRLSVQFDSELGYRMLGVSSFLYTVQFITQLLLISQATLYGQLMWLASIAASWLYGTYLSCLDNGQIQRRLLVDSILNKPAMRKYALGTRTSMAVFALRVMKPDNLEKHLDELLPNDTRVWTMWKENVLRALRSGQRLNLRLDAASKADLSNEEFNLLNTLYEDANAADAAYVLESSYARDVKAV